MGLYIAIIIIAVLIVYSLKDVFSSADAPAWSNMVITGLILFTVILSIFLILHYRALPSGEDKNVKTKQEQTETEKETPEENAAAQPAAAEEISPEHQEAAVAVAQEYIIMEDYYKRNSPELNSYDKAAEYIMKKYDFSQEDWSQFLDHASKYELFKKAKEKMDSETKK